MQLTKQDASNLAKNTAFTKNASQLFLKPSSMTPGQLVSLLKMAGLDVPKGVVVSADFAQIYLSGAAVISNVDRAASIGSYCAPTAAIMSAGLDLMEQAGLVDKKSPGAQILNLGLDTALVIGSCGTNVVADLKFIMDAYSMAQFPNVQAMASQLAKGDLSQYVYKRKYAEKEAFSENFADYHSGKLSSFDLMTKVAQESPDFFYNFYPGFSSFYPPVLIQASVTATVTASNAYGGSKSASSTSTSKPWQSLGLDKLANTEKVWDYVVPNILGVYRLLDARSRSRQCFKMKTLAALSLLPPFIDTYDEKWNPFPTLGNLGLTFADLGEDQIIPNLVDQTLGRSVPPAVVINGKPVTDPVQQANYLAKQRANNSYLQMHQNVLNFDALGDYQNMVKNLDQKSVQFILENVNPVWVDYTVDSRDVANQVKLSPQARCIRNYWSALHFWETVKNNKIYESLTSRLNQYQFLPSIAEIDQLAKELNFKVHMRYLNKMALQKIASFLGTTTDKLYVKNSSELGQKPTIFGVK